MKYRPRIYYAETDKALMLDRWQKGDSLHAIARPKAWLSTPSNQCLQRLTTISTDCEEKRDPRQDATNTMPYLLLT